MGFLKTIERKNHHCLANDIYLGKIVPNLSYSLCTKVNIERNWYGHMQKPIE